MTTHDLTTPDHTETPDQDKPDTVTLITATSLQAWFYEALGDARRDHHFQATTASEHYIVTLLDAFSDADQLFGLDTAGRRRDQALAMILYEAVFGTPTHSIDHYRRMGDVALYVAGVFSDSLHRAAVDASYYIHMGQAAYATLADRLRDRKNAALREIFQELADTFASWVEVLRDLSERIGLSAALHAQHTEDLFARVPLASGGRAQRLYGELAARGAMPGLGGRWQT
jgi:hypothetical protein